MKIFEQIKPIEINFQDEQILVNQHISLLDKRVFVNICVEKYFIKDEVAEEIIGTSDFEKDNSYFYCIIKYMTNIEISDDMIMSDLYDNIVGSGLYDLIYDAIPYNIRSDINRKIEDSIDDIKYKIEEKNSIKNIIVDAIQALISKIPSEKELQKIIKKAKKEFESFDPNKMQAVQEMLKVVK